MLWKIQKNRELYSSTINTLEVLSVNESKVGERLIQTDFLNQISVRKKVNLLKNKL